MSLLKREVIPIWRASLQRVLSMVEQTRAATPRFYLKLWFFFFALNVACYWFGILLIFPDSLFGPHQAETLFVQLPVGLLGGAFDFLSFFVTLFVVRHALATKRAASYLGHLSIDAVIAIIATFWVLFVFSFSGWLFNLITELPETLGARNAAYRYRMEQALSDPFGSWRNITFGLIMGASAMLPTLIHLGNSLRALFLAMRPAEVDAVTTSSD